jgi:hypothetical protein
MNSLSQDAFFDALRFSQATSMAFLRTQERMVGGLLDIVSTTQTAWLKPVARDTAADLLKETINTSETLAHEAMAATEAMLEESEAETMAMMETAMEETPPEDAVAPKPKTAKAKAIKQHVKP